MLISMDTKNKKIPITNAQNVNLSLWEEKGVVFSYGLMGQMSHSLPCPHPTPNCLSHRRALRPEWALGVCNTPLPANGTTEHRDL